MSKKRTRVVLTNEEKKKIIRLKEANPAMTFVDIAEKYYTISKRLISNTTVCKIWANREAIMKDLPYGSKAPKTEVSISQETIRRVDEADAAHIPITESYVIEQAQKIVLEHKLDPSLFFFSADWARSIMKGQKDDVSILRSKAKSAASPVKPMEVSSPKEGNGIVGLVGLTPGKKIALLDSLNTPDSNVETPAITITPLNAAPVDRKRRAPPKEETRTLRTRRVTKKETPMSSLERLKSLIQSEGFDCDYRSLLYSLLEDAYTSNPYFVPIMGEELESVKKTLQFMVEKEGKVW